VTFIKRTGIKVTRRSALALAAGLSVSSGQTDVHRAIPADALSKFGEAGRRKLLAGLSSTGYRGGIDGAIVKDLLRVEATTIDELMVKLLPLARIGSRPPLSDYHVGAVLLGVSNSLYLGGNIEVPGQALGLAVHGEQAAIANAYMHGEDGVKALAVTAAPCGHCRQFLTEMVPGGGLRVLFPQASPTTLAALLPMAFGPQNLGRKQGALPIRAIRLELKAEDTAIAAALEAACRSYAPYTHSPSGVAVVTASGRTFAGAYIENVAFNPSLSPLQTALAGVFAAGEDATGIVRVVLVEAEDARISQKASTEATLASLAPAARLETYRAVRVLRPA
jgi:cytidine deaminase